ncbi:hypothetical protein Molly3_155 [Maribacter phage Molly_3]|uniref:Uncharacterized protein n=1 Tax=Maribacter phage Molly_1 TaxID=2745685 RepID=A0A8E4UYB9_9CAUD|nr:hypothetical protein M1M29_gp155 [Maribacter phage Molly_1]QQO97450.1 hypothetical protein Molly1_155 [Maribacter phage Molly_1]QQO97650.1 hypothetical protein Molly2_155 [Maribacter phage Molly_2]QQO97850.1 hypothetical protein Molly3_155 [Maribacter phage Molly_3]
MDTTKIKSMIESTAEVADIVEAITEAEEFGNDYRELSKGKQIMKVQSVLDKKGIKTNAEFKGNTIVLEGSSDEDTNKGYKLLKKMGLNNLEMKL